MNIREMIRGTKYPFYAEVGEWEDIYAKAKADHPIRYWVAEDLWDTAEHVVTYPFQKYRDIETYVRNRFGTKTHVLRTNLKKGQWCEYSERLLYGMMDSFCIWLEEEWYKHRNLELSKEPTTENILRLFKDRIKDYELDGDDGSVGGSIHNCEEMRDIYLWWKEFKNLPDIFDESGMSDFYDRKESNGSFFSHMEGEQREEWRKLHKIKQRLEKEREEETQDYMIRLVRLRQDLWC